MQNQTFLDYLKEQLYTYDDVIQLNRISNLNATVSFLEELKCPLCQNIIVQPIQCQNCQNNFCQQCHSLWTQYTKTNKCYFCQNDMQNTTVPRLMNSLLNKIQLKCENDNCTDKVQYELRKKHQQECQYQLMQCQYCNEQTMRKDMQKHLQECQNFIVVCQKCKEEVVRNQIRDHDNNQCSFRQVSCNFCESTMEFHLLMDHEQNCPAVYNTCQTCQMKFKIDQPHSRESCLEEQVKKQQQKWLEMYEHNAVLENKLEEKISIIYVLEQQLNEYMIQ